jgi:predicted enzyme related to lactoylglutathione lyase
MRLIKRYNPGNFSWADLGTTNVAAAKKFYKALFGWKVTDYPMGPDGEKYSIFTVKGNDVCAVYPMMEQQRKMKAPPFWLPFVTVKSADASAKKAMTAGGKVFVEPMDVMKQGRMALIQDPTGASVALWQAGMHKGTGIAGTPGAICWHDLNTPKPAAAGKFYAKLFGWKTANQKYSGNAYHLLMLGKKSIGGMWPGPMKKLGPSWLTYWQVASCAKALAKAKKLGASVLLGDTLVPEMCRFAVVRDPQGAAFGLLEPLM